MAWRIDTIGRYGYVYRYITKSISVKHWGQATAKLSETVAVLWSPKVAVTVSSLILLTVWNQQINVTRLFIQLDEWLRLLRYIFLPQILLITHVLVLVQQTLEFNSNKPPKSTSI